jgi:hypothetical protein
VHNDSKAAFVASSLILEIEFVEFDDLGSLFEVFGLSLWTT